MNLILIYLRIISLYSDLFEDNQPLSLTQFRKRKRVVIACSHDNEDPMPENFKHIRNSINVVALQNLDQSFIAL